MNHGHQVDQTLGKEPGEVDEGSLPDPDTDAFLKRMAEQKRVRANRVEAVRTVLVVLSARAMVFDVNSLRQKILLTYPDVAVFFTTPLATPIGAAVPGTVDLLIDFTGPGQRDRFFSGRRLRKIARVAVGRNAGLFRKRIYDRVFDEKARESPCPRTCWSSSRRYRRRCWRWPGSPCGRPEIPRPTEAR